MVLAHEFTCKKSVPDSSVGRLLNGQSRILIYSREDTSVLVAKLIVVPKSLSVVEPVQFRVLAAERSLRVVGSLHVEL
jgi:hypothetical protein